MAEVPVTSAAGVNSPGYPGWQINEEAHRVAFAVRCQRVKKVLTR